MTKLGQGVRNKGTLPYAPDFVHENLPLAGLCDVDHLLHDVVGVLVLHHDVQRGRGAGT